MTEGKAIQAVHRIRDPIYGYIWLTDDELAIVDTPLFQRLRRISQLALTKYVYPTAEHSRFVHSLGVLQAATNIYNEVLRFNPELTPEGNNKNNYLQILRFAALLHDIGHLPFSHAAEKAILGKQFHHEDLSGHIIAQYNPITNILKRNGIDPRVVASLLKGKILRQYVFLKKFISGEFDADRADYLLRDSYFCGVRYGEYDYIRYAGSFRSITGENDEPVFAIEKGNLHAVESFLLARYYYYLQVPYHRTRRGYDLVLERYLMDRIHEKDFPDSGISISENNLKVDFDAFEYFDDFSIFEKIKIDTRHNNPFAKILMRQDRLHPIFDVETNTETNENNFLDLQAKLERKGLLESRDFFVFTQKVNVHGLLQHSDEKGDDVYPVIDKTKDNQTVGTVMNCSSVLAATKDKGAVIRRIYVTSAVRDKADEALQDVMKIVAERDKQRKKNKGVNL